MISRLCFILMICFAFKANGQDSIPIKNELSYKLFSKCFENLNQGSEIFEKYPDLKKNGFCSIQDCILLLVYKEEYVQEIGKARLRGIATQLFREGNPVLLISGMNSSSTALEENENTLDDNNIIYISVGECVIPNYVSIAEEVFNQQTNRLIQQNKNGS